MEMIDRCSPDICLEIGPSSWGETDKGKQGNQVYSESEEELKRLIRTPSSDVMICGNDPGR